MIHLQHIDLVSLSEEHYNEVNPWVSARAKSILNIFQVLYIKQNQRRFPKTSLRNASHGIHYKTRDKILNLLQSIFNNKDIINEYYLILRYTNRYLPKILKGNTDTLIIISKTLDERFSRHRTPSNAKRIYDAEFFPLIFCLNHIFDYDSKFTKKNNNPSVWNAFRLATRHATPICPYCNINSIVTISGDNSGINSSTISEIQRSTFDHFLAQSIYPYLALSFYNLVPSCYICNSTHKRETIIDAENYVHPFVDGFEDKISFVSGVELSEFLDINNYKINLKIVRNTQCEDNDYFKAIKNCELFHLLDNYNAAEEKAKFVFKKSLNISTAYIKSFIDNEFENRLTDIKTKSEFYYHYIGNTYISAEFYKFAYSKFQFDIATETGLIASIQSADFLQP